MAPHAIPHRQSLVSQTIAYLTAEIASGKWPGWLPSERALSEALAVSRNTLRTSLEQLKRDGIIRPVHGAGNQIVAGREKGRHQIKSRDVALLTPVPVELLRPSVALWINELRALLNEQGCRLHEFSGQQYYRSKPGPSLQKLTNLNHHGCWVLVMTPESCQRWFVRNRVPCVLGGSSYPGVDLTSVDLDHRAMCHHAAGVLLGLGHRRIAFLNRRRPWAGDVVSEEGFVDGIRSLSHGEVAPIVVHYDNSVGSFCNVMRRLMGQKSRPTALMVVNSYYYLTVASWLAQRGWRIPRDVSVLSRDHDPFLSFVVPRPSHYSIPPHAYARRMLRQVLECLENSRAARHAVTIMPDFTRGDSIGPPPSVG